MSLNRVKTISRNPLNELDLELNIFKKFFFLTFFISEKKKVDIWIFRGAENWQRTDSRFDRQCFINWGKKMKKKTKNEIQQHD